MIYLRMEQSNGKDVREPYARDIHDREEGGELGTGNCHGPHHASLDLSTVHHHPHNHFIGFTRFTVASPMLMSPKRGHGDISIDIAAAMSTKRPRACNSSKANPTSSTVSELLSASSVSSSSTSHPNDGSLSTFYRGSHHSTSLEILYKPVCTISERPHAGNGASHAALSEKATETADDELQEAHDEVRRLRVELAAKDKMLRDKESQAKQDLLLQTVLSNDQLAKIQEQLRRERNHSRYITEQSKRRASTLEGQLKEERMSLLRALNDVNMCKEDVEHYQALHRIAEEDVAELRQIEAEDRQQRRLKSQGLPPAYGSLDDEDEMPPYGRHLDSGIAGLTTLKRVARSDFRSRTHKAQAMASAPNSSSLDRSERDANFILSLTDALSSVLASIHSFTIYSYGSHAKFDKSASSSNDGRRDDGRRSKATCSCCARLYIELTQRYISAMELRPLTLRFVSQQKVLIRIAFTAIDSTLLDIFYRAFDSRDRLLEMQYYLTLINCVQEQLKINLRSAIPTLSAQDGSAPFFDQCSTWLGEQVEKERQLAAESPAVSDTAVLLDDESDSSTTSSVPAPSVASTMSGSEHSEAGRDSEAGPSNRPGIVFSRWRGA